MANGWLCRCLAAALVLAAPAAASAQDDAPDLPSGLGDDAPATDDGAAGEAGPSLPEGLSGGDGNGDSGDDGPALPQGLGGDDADTTTGAPADGEAADSGPLAGVLANWRLGGYVDTRLAPRLGDKAGQERFSAAETRTEFKALRTWSDVSITLTGHVIGDAVAERHAPDLQDGDGAFDLREASVFWRAAPFMDVKVGRQILTWGTGDFVFLNDLFPKDFRSFFIGRADTLLKAPSDAAKVSLYSDIANLDVVYTPQFDPDRFIDGDRLSYFNPFAGRIVGDARTLDVVQPDDVVADDEVALRLYRNVGRYALALYGYDGFWKSPNALLPRQQAATFARLRVGGASVRGPVPALGGIGSAEFAFYDSRDDRDGTDPTVPNSEARLLFGWDRELAANLTAGVQYLREQRLDHDALVANQPPGAPPVDEVRHLLTGKLTRTWPAEQVTATMFAFYSPSAEDAYIRPRLSWSPTDTVTVEAGLNWFLGERDSTQFGQLDRNDNAFLAVRYGF